MGSGARTVQSRITGHRFISGEPPLYNHDSVGISGGCASVHKKQTEEDSNIRGSKSCDDDWYRLVACHDPRDGDMPLRGVVYRLGSIAGSWAGRFQVSYSTIFE